MPYTLDQFLSLPDTEKVNYFNSGSTGLDESQMVDWWNQGVNSQRDKLTKQNESGWANQADEYANVWGYSPSKIAELHSQFSDKWSSSLPSNYASAGNYKKPWADVQSNSGFMDSAMAGFGNTLNPVLGNESPINSFGPPLITAAAALGSGYAGLGSLGAFGTAFGTTAAMPTATAGTSAGTGVGTGALGFTPFGIGAGGELTGGTVAGLVVDSAGTGISGAFTPSVLGTAGLGAASGGLSSWLSPGTLLGGSLLGAGVANVLGAKETAQTASDNFNTARNDYFTNQYPNSASVDAMKSSALADLNKREMNAGKNLASTLASRGWGGGGLAAKGMTDIYGDTQHAYGDLANKLIQYANTPFSPVSYPGVQQTTTGTAQSISNMLNPILGTLGGLTSYGLLKSEYPTLFGNS